MEMIKIIKIIERDAIEKGAFLAEVVFPSENVYAVTVKDPFQEPGVIETDQEERLRWYFEEHIKSPFTDIERRKRAEHSIIYYGETLFRSLFAEPDALVEWRQLTAGLERIQIQVISTSTSTGAGFQALHWEALKDPKDSKPLCLQGIEIIHTSGKPTLPYQVADSACLNLLMVTARPFGKNDIEYRTITRPVLELIETKRMPVRVHLLRPPTFRHLQEHLREKKGFYHIVHLDMHGGVMSFKAYLFNSANKRSTVRRKLAPYKGTRAFLCLVDEEDRPDLVTADEVAELFQEAHVPICFLDACRSAMMTKGEQKGQKQTRTIEASLAMILLEKGVKLVLGNAWSITETGAKLMITEVYDKLLDEEEILKAVNSGRLKMFEDRTRTVGAKNTLELEDWLLPVIWGKGDFKIRLKPEGFEDRLTVQVRRHKWDTETRGMKTTGTYGFLGRDVDILQVETLLHRDKILLIRGMGGTGKTTLLGHMALWWWKTGWIDHAFYFGYDRKPYRAEEILNTIAEAVVSKEEFGHFLVMPSLEMKSGVLAAYLKESKTTTAVLLILDNLESITGTEKAVGSTLPLADRQDLVMIIRRLLKSSMKILLGSRADEAWLGKETFNDSIYWLEGLDRSSRFALAREILKKNRIEVGNWEEFGRLLEILAGYPLAMEIILPNLAHRTAKELREILTGAGVDMQGGQISEEIFKCVNISFSLLTDRVRSCLVAFAPFTSFLNAMGLEKYLEALHIEGLFKEKTLADLEEALVQAEKQSLVEKVELPKCYTLQPVLPFFLWQQVMKMEGAGQGQIESAALEKAFCGYISLLSQFYSKLMQSKESKEREVGKYLFRQERENLQKALNWVLAEQGDFYTLYNVFSTYYSESTDYHEAIALMEEVLEKIEIYVDAKRDAEFLAYYASVVGSLGTHYCNIKEYFQAREKQKKALELYEKAGLRKEMAVAYHELGMVAAEERDFAEAQRCYWEALKILQEFNDRYSQASTFIQLGIVATEERDFSEAQRCYGEALKICQEFNDRYGQTKTYHELGIVAEEERDFAEAKRCYWKALKLKQEFNDRYGQAKTYHQLGIIAAEERDFAEAKRCHQEELKIFQEFNDRYGQADTYIQLGNIAFIDRDFVEAKRCYSEALKLKQEFKERHGQASTYYQLGMVAEEERDFTEAKHYYQEALKIFQEFNDRYGQAKTYHQLGGTAETERDFAEAKHCYGEALKIKKELNDWYSQASTYHKFGNIAYIERDFIESKRFYQEEMKILQEFNDRYSQASTYHQLGMVAEEERNFAEAKRCYQEALKILQEFNDRYSQTSTYHQLGNIAYIEQDFDEAKHCYREEMKICQEFNDRYGQAGTYHQLGMVAEEERNFAEAKHYYQEALKIFQEFNDRYSQAGTYGQLGTLAHSEMDFPETLRCLSLALEIFLQYNDEYNIEITGGNLAVLFQNWIPRENTIADLECSVEVKEILRGILEKR
jgi:tetratricopeptide (TPR) repeat protein